MQSVSGRTRERPYGGEVDGQRHDEVASVGRRELVRRHNVAQRGDEVEVRQGNS